MRSFLRDAASGKSSKICFKLLSISLSRSAFGTGVDHARNGLKLERGERKIDAAPLVDNILELRGICKEPVQVLKMFKKLQHVNDGTWKAGFRYRPQCLDLKWDRGQ